MAAERVGGLVGTVADRWTLYGTDQAAAERKNSVQILDP